MRNKPKQEDEFIFDKEVPEKFWQILNEQKNLPMNAYLRKKFTFKLFDLKHKQMCVRTKADFHNQTDPTKCICSDCNQPMDWYHDYDCQFILTNVAS